MTHELRDSRGLRKFVPVLTSSMLLLLAAISACTVERRDSDDDDGGAGGGALVDDDDASSNGSGNGKSYTVADACAGIQRREAVCYEGSIDESACQGAGACFRLMTRDEYEPKLLSCYAELRNEPACESKHCIERVFPEWQLAHGDHENNCVSYLSRCGTDGGDICRNEFGHLESELLQQMAPCLAGPCAQLDACIAGVVANFGGGCDPYPLL